MQRLLSRIDEGALRRRIRALAENTLGDQLDMLLLFGSRARGTADADSDWDVLVMLREQGDARASAKALVEVTGQIAEETGEQVNFRVFRWADADESASLLTSAARDAVRL